LVWTTGRGIPERTTTAIGRWYSFHGKFIITEQSSIVLSANFTRVNELDACIIIRNEKPFNNHFLTKFQELLRLFVNENGGYSGKIRQEIIDSNLNNTDDIFDLPNVIETETHRKNWVRHYPASMCPDDINIKEKLYIAPFDVKGRKIYEKTLNESEDFVYISAESFTDVDFGLYLRKLKNSKRINIKLLTGSTSMDFTNRIQKMYRELLANDIQLFTLKNNLHAKLVITDKHLLVGSLNLNKMNLGFNKTKKFWRENTETFFTTTDFHLIETAKSQFENQLSNSIKMEEKLSNKIQGDVSKLLNKSFKIKTKKEVKELFSKFILYEEINTKKDANKLVRITKKLMQHYNIRTANKELFFMSLILFYLQSRKHTFSEIEYKLNELETVPNLNTLFDKLSESGFAVVEHEFYKLNIDSLF